MTEKHVTRNETDESITATIQTKGENAFGAASEEVGRLKDTVDPDSIVSVELSIVAKKTGADADPDTLDAANTESPSEDSTPVPAGTSTFGGDTDAQAQTDSEQNEAESEAETASTPTSTESTDTDGGSDTAAPENVDAEAAEAEAEEENEAEDAEAEADAAEADAAADSEDENGNGTEGKVRRVTEDDRKLGEVKPDTSEHWGLKLAAEHAPSVSEAMTAYELADRLPPQAPNQQSSVRSSFSRLFKKKLVDRQLRKGEGFDEYWITAHGRAELADLSASEPDSDTDSDAATDAETESGSNVSADVGPDLDQITLQEDA